MRVLVTGHLGYIGCAVVPMLQTAGHEVVGLDSDLFGQCTFGAGVRRPDDPQGPPGRGAAGFPGHRCGDSPGGPL